MNKTFFKIGLGWLALAGVLWSSHAAMTGMKTLSGHVPRVVSQLAATGRLSATTNLYLSIGLPLRNQAEMTTLLQQMYDPASTNYQHYLTPDEFTARFGPTSNDYQAVLNFATTNGLEVVHTHSNRMLVDVVARVPDVERAFHVHMNTYRHPTEARNFYAPDTEPSVDASLPILAVQGMNNYLLPHPLLYKRPSTLPQPSIGSGPGGGFIGRDFRNAYVPGTPLNGSGQIVGLLQFDGYYPSDIQTYTALAGLTNVPLQNVLLDGFNGAPGGNNGEVCLDINMSMSMAPALAKIVVFEAGPFGNPDDILNAMAANPQIKQLSASWAYGIDPTTVQIYIQFALQGQTYFNASGDGDAWVGSIPWGSLENQYITVVGGTTLTMNGTANSYASEKAWNWGFDQDYSFNPDGYAGTSGGVSTDISIPTWQQGFGTVTNHGSATFRNTPDVALTADNIFLVSSGGQEGIWGGTSAASPLWAGFMALVNQQAVASNRPSIGFLAPVVYAIANSPGYTSYFHDVTAGDNTWPESPTNFFAVPGYDLCTGVGTPNGTNLINLLTSGTGVAQVYVPVIPAPKQPWGNTLSVMNGANPNGLWLLYYQDDKKNNFSGTNYNGWAVNLTTANPVGFAGDNEIYVNTTVDSHPYGNATNVPAFLGSVWQTVLSITNYGPSLSTNVFVTDTLPLPSAVALVSSNSSIPGSSITVFGETLTWNAGNLAVNAGGTLTLNFIANNTGIYTNSAIVNATTTDPNTDDNTVAVIATVSVSTPPIVMPHLIAGGGGEFQLTVTNDAGANMVIQASTNLVSWLPVYTNISPFVFTNFDTTNFPQRFYRAVVGP